MIIKKNKKQVEGIEAQEQVQEQVVDKSQEAEIDLFNLDHIDFKQRNERRKGDRRRGFRRIDDRNLISRAKEEADAIREAAYKEGYQSGLDQASYDLQEVKDAISEFLSAKQDIYDSIAPDVLEISLDIAKKIIKKEVSEDPSIILDNIKEILSELSKEETKIMIKANPSQVAILKDNVPEQVEAAGLEAKVVVMPDDGIMEGGCLVTTTNGVIDSTIETKMGIITKVLKEI